MNPSVNDSTETYNKYSSLYSFYIIYSFCCGIFTFKTVFVVFLVCLCQYNVFELHKRGWQSGLSAGIMTIQLNWTELENKIRTKHSHSMFKLKPPCEVQAVITLSSWTYWEAITWEGVHIKTNVQFQLSNIIPGFWTVMLLTQKVHIESCRVNAFLELMKRENN